MSFMSLIEQITERIDRLLLRHTELQRTHTLQAQQIANLTAECESLKARLHSARTRVDALLEQLPQPPIASKDAQ